MSMRHTRLGAVVALAATLVALLSAALASHAQAVTVDYCSFADTPVTQMSADRSFRAIHCLTNPTSLGARDLPDFGSGMRSSRLGVTIRRYNSLCSGLPGTTTPWPPPLEKRPSRVSRRNWALRLFLSGP